MLISALNSMFPFLPIPSRLCCCCLKAKRKLKNLSFFLGAVGASKGNATMMVLASSFQCFQLLMLLFNDNQLVTKISIFTPFDESHYENIKVVKNLFLPQGKKMGLWPIWKRVISGSGMGRKKGARLESQRQLRCPKIIFVSLSSKCCCQMHSRTWVSTLEATEINKGKRQGSKKCKCPKPTICLRLLSMFFITKLEENKVESRGQY